MIDLKRFRKDNKIKQADICTVLNVSQPYISAIERGLRPLNEEQFRLLYNQYGDILLPYKMTERPIFDTQESAKVEIPREVFDKISRLIDTVCSQQNTIAGQQDLLLKQQDLVNKALNPPPHTENNLDGGNRGGKKGSMAAG